MKAQAAVAMALLILLAAASEATAGETGLFVTCDNGLRCLRPPCPARDTLNLVTGERFARTDMDVSALPEEQRSGEDFLDGTYYGTLAFEGMVERGTTDAAGSAKPTVTIRASAIARQASEDEARLCRGG